MPVNMFLVNVVMIQIRFSAYVLEYLKCPACNGFMAIEKLLFYFFFCSLSKVFSMEQFISKRILAPATCEFPCLFVAFALFYAQGDKKSGSLSLFCRFAKKKVAKATICE